MNILISVQEWPQFGNGHLSTQSGYRSSQTMFPMTQWQKVLQDPVKHEKHKAALRERMRKLRAKRNKMKAASDKQI